MLFLFQLLCFLASAWASKLELSFFKGLSTEQKPNGSYVVGGALLLSYQTEHQMLMASLYNHTNFVVSLCCPQTGGDRRLHYRHRHMSQAGMQEILPVGPDCLVVVSRTVILNADFHAEIERYYAQQSFSQFFLNGTGRVAVFLLSPHSESSHSASATSASASATNSRGLRMRVLKDTSNSLRIHPNLEGTLAGTNIQISASNHSVQVRCRSFTAAVYAGLTGQPGPAWSNHDGGIVPRKVKPGDQMILRWTTDARPPSKPWHSLTEILSSGTDGYSLVEQYLAIIVFEAI